MAWLTLAAVLIVLEGAALPSLERGLAIQSMRVAATF